MHEDGRRAEMTKLIVAFRKIAKKQLKTTSPPKLTSSTRRDDYKNHLAKKEVYRNQRRISSSKY